MDVHSSWVPKTAEEKDQVRRQMERLLETAHFRNSRRYPALLRFIVEETLEGRGEFLKERLLGIRVFQRPPDYDTADDPIARVTIAEIRKRIAQYYHEEAHDAEMRIELLPGRYEPEFLPRRVMAAAVPVADAVPVAAKVSSRRFARRFGSRFASGWWLGGLAVLAALAAVVWMARRPAAIDELWNPVLGSRQVITFCLPGDAAGSRIAGAAGILTDSVRGPGPVAPVPDPAQSSFLDYEKKGQNLVFSDVLATLKMSTWLATHTRDQRLRLDSSTTLDDLQQGPTILVGGLDNAWTLRAVGRLRYRFRGTDQERYWISDARDTGSRRWAVDLTEQYPAVKRDYALIARVHDDSTRQIEVIVAGIGMSGTAAAGEFMVDPNRLEELRKRVGRGFRDHDFEAVLGTDVVNGIPGSPRILAVEVW